MDQLVGAYNSVIGIIIDKHAHLLKKRVTVQPLTEWFYVSIGKAHSVRCMLPGPCLMLSPVL